MNDLRELYQEVILDHNKRPRNFGAMPEATGQAEGHNPLCGDQVTVFVEVGDGLVRDVRFTGVGCAISVASASLMTEAVKGRTVEDAQRLFGLFRDGMTGQGDLSEISGEAAEIEALSGVKEYPVRIKCATLPWHTLVAALEGEKAVTTEED